MTDYKALCAELAQPARREHRYCEDSWYSCPKAEGGCSNDSAGSECDCGADECNAKVDAICAALAEGVGVGAIEASTIQVERLAELLELEADDEDMVASTRWIEASDMREAAKLLRHTIHPQAPIPVAEGAGVGVTDEELDKTLFQALDEYMRQKSPFGGPTDQKQLDRAKARAVLARFGNHPRPIPVAERPPTEADCDAEGRCWWFHPGCEVTTPFWYLADCEYPDRATPYDPSAWLPAAAIPLPEASP